VPVLPAIIVTQTLVELLSELAYVRFMPKVGKDLEANDPHRAKRQTKNSRSRLGEPRMLAATFAPPRLKYHSAPAET
jgi:hypothetical protein